MRFRAFLASFPLPIIAVDSQRRVVSWNAAAEQLLGWTASEVIGGEDPSVPPEVAAETKTLWEAAFRGGPAVQRESARMTRSGEVLDVVISTGAVPPAEGEERLALMMVRDATEERAAEDRLAERENELRLVLEPAAARLAAGKVDVRGLKKMDAICRKGYVPGDAMQGLQDKLMKTALGGEKPEPTVVAPAAVWGFAVDKAKDDEDAGVKVTEVLAKGPAASGGTSPAWAVRCHWAPTR